jgi:hypothetical protein
MWTELAARIHVLPPKSPQAPLSQRTTLLALVGCGSGFADPLSVSLCFSMMRGLLLREDTFHHHQVAQASVPRM